MAKVVTAKRSETRCRICGSGKRETWENVYAAYLNGQPDPLDGKTKLTWDLLASKASLLAGSEVNVRSVRRHAEGHCLVVGESEAAELDTQAARDGELLEEVLAEIDGILDGAGTVSPQALLGLQEKLFLMSVRRKVAAGELPNVSMDQGARAAEKLIASSKKAEEATLLSMLTQGIGSVFQRELASRGELPLVVEGEIVDEEEDEA